MERAMSERRSGMDRRRDGDRRRLTDRRAGNDRRQVAPDIPGAGISRLLAGDIATEQRTGRDRRSGADKRIGIDRRCGIDRRVDEGWRNAELGGRLSPESALDLVSDFYSASLDPRFWPTALTKLADALGAQACALARHDFSVGDGRIEHAVGFEVTAIEAFGEHFGRASEWLNNEDAFRQPGTVLFGQDLVGEVEEDRSEFFSHWLGPQSLRHQMFAVVERKGHKILYVYAARRADSGAFGSAEAGLMRRLLPYLQRGLRSGLVLKRSQNLRQLALDALDTMPLGVLLVSASGAVLGTNRVARDVINAREVLWIGRNGLELNRDGRRTLFRDLFGLILQPRGNNHRNAASQHPPGSGFSVPRPSGQRPLSFLIWPYGENLLGASWDDPAAIVFVGDPDRSADIDEDRLRQLYGLTRAEARVAAELARGYRLDEIAERLGVAYETTRKHLKKVLSKVETDRQADLVRTIVTGPGVLAR